VRAPGESQHVGKVLVLLGPGRRGPREFSRASSPNLGTVAGPSAGHKVHKHLRVEFTVEPSFTWASLLRTTA